MIGVIDSGSGGLTVLQALVKAMPRQSFVYFGDHKNAPYGNRTPDEIYELTLTALEKLFAQGCSLVVIACNTAAATCLRRLQREWLPVRHPGKRVIGVLVPLIEAVTQVPWSDEAPSGSTPSMPRTIGVFATRRTVQSQVFPREIAKRAPATLVVQQACPALVPLIEQGALGALGTSEDRLTEAVGRYVRLLTGKLEGRGLDAVILGCTHYPLVADLFRDMLPANVGIVSQPEITAQSLAAYLARHPEFTLDSQPTIQFYTSGNQSAVSALASHVYAGAASFSQI